MDCYSSISRPLNTQNLLQTDNIVKHLQKKKSFYTQSVNKQTNKSYFVNIFQL